jgi:hypothetical protein
MSRCVQTLLRGIILARLKHVSYITTRINANPCENNQKTSKNDKNFSIKAFPSLPHSQHALLQNKPDFKVLSGVAGRYLNRRSKCQTSKHKRRSTFNIYNISCYFDPERGTTHNWHFISDLLSTTTKERW